MVKYAPQKVITSGKKVRCQRPARFIFTIRHRLNYQPRPISSFLLVSKTVYEMATAGTALSMLGTSARSCWLPELRPASANQPLGPRWPALQAFIST